jgi:NAD(P)-dependent dehydrogenase (short-subunit alcohol dehydrogenase family)
MEEVALVTGAAEGIGRAIALGLLAEGMEVWIIDVHDPQGPEGRFARVDVTDEVALSALIAEVRPDVLVNNAGGGGHIPPHFPDASPDQWGAVLDLNLRAAMRATQLALEYGAHAVVNIASVAGTEEGPHAAPEYAAAKAGLIRFTTALADLRAARVNCIVPGWIATPRGLAEAAAMTPQEREAAGPMVSMPTIVNAVIGLTRDDAARGRIDVLR